MLVIEPLVAAVAIVFLVPSLVVVGRVQPILDRLSRSKITVVRCLGESVLQGDRDRASKAAESDTLIDRIYDLRLRFANLRSRRNRSTSSSRHAIDGRTEIGIIVSFMSGYDRMTNPVRDLLNFYRRLSMMRVQYRLVADAFA